MQQDIRGRMPQQRRLIQFAIVGTATSLIFLLFLKYRGPLAPDKFVLPTAVSSPKDGSAEEFDWSRFAYVQYVTTVPYLCNAVMLFDRLHELGSKADRLLLYPRQYSLDESEGNAAGILLRKARDEYGVILNPIDVQHKDSADPTWADSFTKLHAFNQTAYSRVLHLDSDSTILSSMDELFLLPPAIVAMPRSYWELQEPHIKLSTQLVLITPSTYEYERCRSAIDSAVANEYDMEILNALYRDMAMVLPHKIYDLYSREFRMGPDHKEYLGTDKEAVWDPDEAARTAKFLHFSDWPLPKPWIEPSQRMWEENMPKCFNKDGTTLYGKSESLCRERELWFAFYKDFKTRRKNICGAAI